jgi:hypothetical protein
VVSSEGGEPNVFVVGVVNRVNAAAAPTIGIPIDELGATGQLAGGVISPLAKASLLASSRKPSAGATT